MIRPVDPRELEKFVDLCIAHSKDAGMDHDEINRMFLRKQLKQMLIEPNYQIFVAEQHGSFVGYVMGSIHEKLYNAKQYGELLFIFIHPEIRNKLILWHTTKNGYAKKNMLTKLLITFTRDVV